MTNTTAATYTIPTQGLTHTAADGTSISATHRPTGGILIQIRYPNHEIGGQFHTFETHAVAHWNRLVELFPVAAAPAAARIAA